MNKTALTTYLINFRRLFSKYLKPDVGVQIIAYPFDKGAIIIADPKFNIPNKDEIRSESADINEAMKRTNLFENPSEANIVSGTKIIISDSKIIIIKEDKEGQWTEESANSDIHKVVKSINENI